MAAGANLHNIERGSGAGKFNSWREFILIGPGINKGSIKGITGPGSIDNWDLKARVTRLFLFANGQYAVSAAGDHQRGQRIFSA